MEDNKPILKNGTATPYLAIFNSKKRPIIDSKSGLPIGMNVSGWWYEYDEEKEDTAEITIETDNPDLLDNPDLAEKAIIKMQWGWLFDDGSIHCGPIRTVTIVDTQSDFSEVNVKITLVCNDGFVVTKNTSADMSEKVFTTWLKSNIQGDFTVEIIDYSAENQVFIKPKK